jgi:hypothetical protein
MHSWGPSQSPRNRTDPPTPFGVESLTYPVFAEMGLREDEASTVIG